MNLNMTEFTYTDGWEKEELFNYNGKELKVRLFFESYNEEDINDKQKEAYLKYTSNYNEDLIAKSLLEYYLNNYDYIKAHNDIPTIALKENIDENVVKKLIKIRTIYFAQDGTYGLLCDCGWDIEHGIAIILSSDKPLITDQDELI